MALEKNPVVLFENTENAFIYKTDSELKQAKFLFSSMGYKWLVNIGTRLTPWAIKAGLPVKSLIRKTVFKQFVGGQSLEETIPVVSQIAKFGVGVILDYGVEGGEDGELAFNASMKEFINVIDFAATQSSIPFISIKVTGFSRFTLLEKLDENMQQHTGSLVVRYQAAMAQLTDNEHQEWKLVTERMEQICIVAAQKNIGVLVDAEETWIQDPVDALTCLMMDRFNKKHCVVYNTVQLYRHDRFVFLQDMLEASQQRAFILGVKIVRGAYMEKERIRAEEKGYASPIQANKENTDTDYNKAIELCITNLESVSVIVASHNELSNKLAVNLVLEKGYLLTHPHVHFSQLYGMSDNITFNLAKLGCNVSKYLPFGPLEDVIPYLMRRAQENSSVSGQTGRELMLIKRELKRRENIRTK